LNQQRKCYTALPRIFLYLWKKSIGRQNPRVYVIGASLKVSVQLTTVK